MTIRAENEMTLVRVDDGQDGSTPYISADKYWYIDGVSTGIKAEGTDGDSGTPIVWKGSLASAPSNPVVDWCYRNTTDGKVYIYNGSAWVLMTQDGEPGTDGTDGKSAHEAAIEGGLPEETTEEEFNNDLADTPNKTNQEETDELYGQLTQEIADRIAESLVNEQGYNVVSVDATGITIKGTVDGSSTMRISSSELALMAGVYEAAMIRYDAELGSLLKAENASHAVVQMRNPNGEGSLGWVAQENGHLTLKEV